MPKAKDQKYREAVERNLSRPSQVTMDSSVGRLKALADPSIENARIRTGIRKSDMAWDDKLKAVQAKAQHVLADVQAKAAKPEKVAVADKPAAKPAAKKAKPALFSVDKASKPTARG